MTVHIIRNNKNIFNTGNLKIGYLINFLFKNINHLLKKNKNCCFYFFILFYFLFNLKLIGNIKNGIIQYMMLIE